MIEFMVTARVDGMYLYARSRVTKLQYESFGPRLQSVIGQWLIEDLADALGDRPAEWRGSTSEVLA